MHGGEFPLLFDPGKGRTRERGDLATAERAEFGAFAEQGGQDGRSDAGDGVQQARLLGQDLILGDEACDLSVELGNLLAEQRDHGLDGLRNFGLTRAVTMQFFGFAHIDQLPATPQEISQARTGRAERDGGGQV
jgi:hypothetical protein